MLRHGCSDSLNIKLLLLRDFLRFWLLHTVAVEPLRNMCWKLQPDSSTISRETNTQKWRTEQNVTCEKRTQEYKSTASDFPAPLINLVQSSALWMEMSSHINKPQVLHMCHWSVSSELPNCKPEQPKISMLQSNCITVTTDDWKCKLCRCAAKSIKRCEITACGHWRQRSIMHCRMRHVSMV